MKITVECLTRKISELNLFFESILKLIDISVKDINEIAKILGVSNSTVKEAVIDMVSIDYIYVSENTLGITKKGENALKTKQKIDIQKTYLNNIIVDMITGTVYDADAIKVSDTQPRDVLLEDVIKLDEEFLESHFHEINNVYQLQQKNNSVFESNAITSELYKTIGISYSKLYYVENKVYMYGSESSNELMFAFSSDSNDQYKNEFYNQLKDSCRPCQEFFFEKNRALIDKIQSNPSQIEWDVREQTEHARELLFADNVTEEVKADIFTQKRYALNDREYLSYLYNPKSLKYNAIFICSDHMHGLLSPVFCSQLNALANRIPVFIIFDKSEKSIEKSFQFFFKNPSANLYLISNDNIEENFICFGSEVIMYLHENIVTAFDRPVVYMQALCDFDKKIVMNTASELVRKYNLDKYAKINSMQNQATNRRRKKRKQK